MSWSAPVPIERGDPDHAIVVEPGTHRHCEVRLVHESPTALTVSLDVELEQHPATPFVPTGGSTVFVARPGRGWAIGTIGAGRGNELVIQLARPLPVHR